VGGTISKVCGWGFCLGWRGRGDRKAGLRLRVLRVRVVFEGELEDLKLREVFCSWPVTRRIELGG